VRFSQFNLLVCVFNTLLLLLPATALCDSAIPTKSFDNPKHGFSITLPQNWTTIPADKMAAFNEQAAQTIPGWKGTLIHYGYQQEVSATGTIPAYILIRVMELTDKPTADFVKAEVTRESTRDDRVRIEAPAFDPSLNAYVAACEIRLQGQVVAKNQLAFFPAEKSIIKLFCFAPPSAVESQPNLLRQMIQGVRVYPSADHGRSESLVVYVLSWGVVILVVTVLFKQLKLGRGA